MKRLLAAVYSRGYRYISFYFSVQLYPDNVSYDMKKIEFHRFNMYTDVNAQAHGAHSCGSGDLS